MQELSVGEMSALCTNLAKGCDKQYRIEEADLFNQLAEYYKSKRTIDNKSQLEDIESLIQQDLTEYPKANLIVAEASDRGALRSLVWGEKVTKMVKVILNNYKLRQNTLLEDTKVYVCEICGFIYIGDHLPDICPVCKVPKNKIKEVKRG